MGAVICLLHAPDYELGPFYMQTGARYTPKLYIVVEGAPRKTDSMADKGN